MEGKNWDDGMDDPNFDSRLFWMKENSEDLTNLIFEKKKFDLDVFLLAFIEQAPRTLFEIMNHFKWSLGEGRSHLQSLRRRGVIFKTERDKGTDCLIYSVRERPKQLKFFYPKAVNRYK